MVEFANIEAAFEMKRRLNGDTGQDPVDRGIIGNSSRIDLPLRDRHILRKAAEHLRALGDTLDILTRRSESGETALLLQAKIDISRFNRAIRDIHGQTNKNGTFRGS